VEESFSHAEFLTEEHEDGVLSEHLRRSYLHILCSHMLVQLKEHKNLQKFSQQGPEHWIGLLQAMYMKHTNRRDTRSVSEGLNPRAWRQ